MPGTLPLLEVQCPEDYIVFEFTVVGSSVQIQRSNRAHLLACLRLGRAFILPESWLLLLYVADWSVNELNIQEFYNFY
jgi:hypothetical protein